MLTPKHHRLYEDLRDRIVSGELQPGQLLPKQTELMRQYRVALGTVRQALVRLKQERWTCTRSGQGTFVRGPEEREESLVRGTAVALVCFDNAHANPPHTQFNPVVHDQVLKLQHAVRQHQHELVVRVFDRDQLSTVGRWCKQFAGVVAYGTVTESMLRSIEEHKTPVCVIGDVDEGVCPASASQILTDLGGGAEMALEYLTNQEHRRILFLNRGGTNANRILSEFFHRYICERRLDRASRELVVADAEQEEQVIAHMSSLDLQPTAVLTFGGMLACRMIRRLERFGYTVPGRIGVMAINTVEPTRLSEPELSRVQFDMGLAVRLAADILQEQIKTGKSVRHMVTPRLYWGHTCGLNSAESTPAKVGADL